MGIVDAHVECLMNNSYLTAKNFLNENCPLLDHLAKVLVQQEVVSAEEFQMMIVEFGVKTSQYDVIGQEKNHEKLPFHCCPA
eukprot:1974964-Ditylum_brightwellii.AAC.1